MIAFAEKTIEKGQQVYITHNTQEIIWSKGLNMMIMRGSCLKAYFVLGVTVP